MANVTPRRRQPSSSAAPRPREEDAPWSKGDPDKKFGLNVPLPEPLMMQLDYLVQNRAIHSKSSFIRDVVSAAATAEIEKLRRVQEAMRRIEKEERARR
ncbi:hypothetical protein [Burkholderia multivorans]|uniref:hypothetical protein n=1 Tax=Burkholderia multivorans TaxID=87883 RepID=UPI001C219842|nr:hypothetical protein [Burkholderia multivorans]ULR75143.1 hypothetical protein JC1_71 [Burkholderia phage JC1]MBU9386657.1 hypothetical protein [Burkholderia multivorans]MBU9437091.1 hypothetical protein [Burkholderia multivorans]MBU9606296.1 hypothetical protein [Burkholderia multivorans]MBU9624855.1 hypothetical protein [Burkholderia multivorans]